MLFEWSAECAADAPLVIVPWTDPASGLRFVDIRADPDAVDLIAEAEQHPRLLQTLRALNAGRSPFFTAKCDVWSMGPEELEPLRLELDLGFEESAIGCASYIDTLLRDRGLFASFHQHEHLVHRLERRITPLDHPAARLDCVIRPALVELDGIRQGFALSLYVMALGANAVEAYDRWTNALEAVTSTLRRRDLLPRSGTSTPPATIVGEHARTGE